MIEIASAALPLTRAIEVTGAFSSFTVATSAMVKAVIEVVVVGALEVVVGILKPGGN